MTLVFFFTLSWVYNVNSYVYIKLKFDENIIINKYNKYET